MQCHHKAHAHVGTKHGAAAGVKLDTLSKLTTLRAGEASQGSLMNFLAMMADQLSSSIKDVNGPTLSNLLTFSDVWTGKTV